MAKPMPTPVAADTSAPRRRRSQERVAPRVCHDSHRNSATHVLRLCVMERVGVRELRQNLSVYLRRVRNGEALEVTERGRPVARLQPLLDLHDAAARLEAR